MGYRRGVATIYPFAALRPAAGLAERACCPPYDVINSREARALAAGNADSFLRVARPEVDLPPEVDEHADEVYAKGRENLDAFARGEAGKNAVIDR